MAAAVPNNLPLQLSSFIGREREIAEVTRLLAASRLVTLTGAGGSGKTRLALEVAAALCRDGPPGRLAPERLYPDGVWFIDLAPISDPALVAGRIAAVLSVTEQAGQPLLMSLAAALQSSQLLLILDNCEHLIATCAQVAEMLLQACARLSIVATSREPLNIAGETTFIVPSLTVPDPGRVSSFETLNQYEAVRLFVERAQAARPAFALTAENEQPVSAICRQLDGMPLAIELAAARTSVLSVEEVAQRLSDRFQLLTGGKRTALPRHQTLRAAIDWSYQLLSIPERVLLQRLSVFAGSWTLEAAETVCSDEGRGAAAGKPAIAAAALILRKADVLDLTARLVEKSLILATEYAGETRYRMLETIRQFAGAMLELSGETTWLADRHLSAFLSLAERAAPVLRSGRRAEWLDRIEADHDNMRAALRCALMSDQTETGYRLSGALFWFWRMRNHTGEARRWYTSQLERDNKRALTAARVGVLHCAAQMAYWQGDYKVGRPWAEESVAGGRAVGDRLILGQALSVLAYVAGDQRDIAVAQPAAEEAVALFRSAGDRWGLAYALISLDIALRRKGDFALARTAAAESVAIFRELNDLWLMAVPLSHLGAIAMEEGDYTKAKLLIAERVAIHRQFGDKRLMAFALGFLGDASRGLEQYDQAAAVYEEEIRILRELGGDRATIAGLWTNLGRVALAKGDSLRAGRCFGESLRMVVDERVRDSLGNLLDGVATLLTAQGLPTRAARLFGAAEAEMRSSGGRLSAVNRVMHKQSVAAIESKLGEAALAQAWADGSALSTAEVIAEIEQMLVVQSAEPPPPVSSEFLAGFPAGLTARELEVLRLVAQGLTDPQIAEQLVISTRTVHAHLRSIYGKLDVTTRTAAARIALEHKLV